MSGTFTAAGYLAEEDLVVTDVVLVDDGAVYLRQRVLHARGWRIEKGTQARGGEASGRCLGDAIGALI